MEGYREKALRSFKELKAELARLDPDAGIRIKGALKEFREGGFIFISRSPEGFTVNICDAIRDEKTGLLLARGRERWLKFKSLDEVMELIIKAAQRPLRDYLY